MLVHLSIELVAGSPISGAVCLFVSSQQVNRLGRCEEEEEKRAVKRVGEVDGRGSRRRKRKGA